MSDKASETLSVQEILNRIFDRETNTLRVSVVSKTAPRTAKK